GIDLAIDLDVPYDVVMERMLARGRADDTPEAIQRRLDLYEEQTHPLLDLYSGQGKLVRVDGVGTEAEVEARLLAAITEARSA
ncbi:adenylate kinase, partial [cyanobacterium TDX16]